MCYDVLNYPQLGQRFDDFVEGMMAEIDAKSVKTLVVDVRAFAHTPAESCRSGAQ